MLCRPEAEGNTALCHNKRPAKFTNGLEAPDRSRLRNPTAPTILARCARRFHPSLRRKRSPPWGDHRFCENIFVFWPECVSAISSSIREMDALQSQVKSISRAKKNMQERIRRKIQDARSRAKVKKPYLIEPTGRGRTKCHADNPDLYCPRCRRRLLMRRLRESASSGSLARPEKLKLQT